jgi:hypothetical protein
MIMLLCLWLLAMNSFMTTENNHKIHIFYALCMFNVPNAYRGGHVHSSVCAFHLYTNLFYSPLVQYTKKNQVL